MDQSLHQRIRERAYEMWDAGGRLEDQSDQHWLAAEREVLAEMTRRPASEPAAAQTSRRRSPERAGARPQRKKMAKAS